MSRFFPKAGEDGSLECCCDDECCVIARVEVRDCDRTRLVVGATVTVKEKTEDHDGATVATGVTDDTGTVALTLPTVRGRRYEVEVSGGSEGEEGVTRKTLRARCGVNTVEVDYGAPQELCIKVVDSETGTPVEGIEVAIWLMENNGTWRKFKSATSGGDGLACIEIESGGIYNVSVNGGGPIVGGLPNGINPDYWTASREIVVPNCGPHEETIPIQLITNHPGCFIVIVLGCHCGLEGATVTLRGRVQRGVTPPLQSNNEWEEWTLTQVTNASGRAIFCPTEEVPALGGDYYDSERDAWDRYELVWSSVDAPEPYEDSPPHYAMTGNVPGQAPPPQINYHHVYTHEGYFCNGDDNCLDEMPDTVTVTISEGTGLWAMNGTWTLNRNPDLNGGAWWNLCIPGYSLTFSTSRLGWCEPFDESHGWFTLYRLFIECDDPGPFDFQTAEMIFQARGVSGTSACPIQWEGEQWTKVWGGSSWIESWGPRTVTVTG